MNCTRFFLIFAFLVLLANCDLTSWTLIDSSSSSSSSSPAILLSRSGSLLWSGALQSSTLQPSGNVQSSFADGNSAYLFPAAPIASTALIGSLSTHITSTCATFASVKGCVIHQIGARIWRLYSKDNAPSSLFVIGANSMTQLATELITCSSLSSPLSTLSFRCTTTSSASVVIEFGMLNVTGPDSASVVAISFDASLPVPLASATSVSALPQVFLDIVALAAFRTRAYRDSLSTIHSVAVSNLDRLQTSRVFAGVVWAHIMLGSIAMTFISAVLQAWRKPGVECGYPVSFWFALLFAVLGGLAVGGGVIGWLVIVFLFFVHAVVISIQYCCRVYLCCPSCLRRCACCCCITVDGGTIAHII